MSEPEIHPFIDVRIMLDKEGRYSVGSAFHFGADMTDEDEKIYRELMHGLLYMASFEGMELRRKAQSLYSGIDMLNRMEAQEEEDEEDFDYGELPDNVIPFPGPRTKQ